MSSPSIGSCTLVVSVWCSVALSGSTPALATPGIGFSPQGPVSWVADFGLEVGLSLTDAPALGVGRVRVGLLRADASDLGHPFFMGFNAFAELSGSGVGTFGVQTELTSLLWGLFGGVGVGVDSEGFVAAQASIGWSLFAVEAQWRQVGVENDIALIAKIRLPIGIVAWTMSDASY
jgi:hypothetical protein